MIKLSNQIIALSLDDQARLVSFENLKTGHGNIISDPMPIFRAVLKNGENWEDVAYAKNAEIALHTEGNKAVIDVSALNTRMGNSAIHITMNIFLDDEKVRFSAVVENHSEAVLDDFIYPCIGAIRTLGEGKPGLLYPFHYGDYHTDICAELSNMQRWNGGFVLTAPYPWPLSMQWMTLIDGNTCLYFAGHDDLFHATSLRAAGGEDRMDVTLEMDKLAFVEPGETWVCPEYVLWLYQGGWQKGAEEYAEWAESWRRPVTPKKWMQDMNGYFLVITKQQYGDELWPYDTLPRLYELAQEHGCDTVGLFGWFHSGHDNMYPDLEVSRTMGGEQMLKDGIRAIQEKGGHVTLYNQGHLIDLNTNYYKTIGNKIEGKSRWGTPYYEEYSKFAESDFLRMYSRKIFATVCPWCKPWHDLMAQKADWVRSFGADGILYDQIGGINPTPCFDKSHGHKKPSLSYTQGRLKLLPAIRESVDKYNEFSFMTETATDVYSQFIDCIHGIGSTTGVKGDRQEYVESPRPMVFNSPEMFRTTFPGTISTLRNPHPYLHPRMVNYALCYGFRFELELRYLSDKNYVEENRTPEWKTYAQAVCALRRRFSDLLLQGTYHCDPALSNANPGMHHGVFTNGDQQCVVFWNDSDTVLPLNTPGYAFSKWVSPDSEGSGTPAEIAPNSAIVLF